MNPDADVILSVLIRCWGAKQSYKKVQKPFFENPIMLVSYTCKSDKTITRLLWLEHQFTEDQKVAGSIPAQKHFSGFVIKLGKQTLSYKITKLQVQSVQPCRFRRDYPDFAWKSQIQTQLRSG